MRKSRSHAVERLSVPDRHRLRIARDTLKMNDVMARVLGGMTKDEARQVIKELTGKEPVDTVPSTNPHQ
jgi:hypothetical protein